MQGGKDAGGEADARAEHKRRQRHREGRGNALQHERQMPAGHRASSGRDRPAAWPRNSRRTAPERLDRGPRPCGRRRSTSGGASGPIMISAGSLERRKTTKANVTTMKMVKRARATRRTKKASIRRPPSRRVAVHARDGRRRNARPGDAGAPASTPAEIDRERAARMEGAARRPGRRVRRLALQQDARGLPAGHGTAASSALV